MLLNKDFFIGMLQCYCFS